MGEDKAACLYLSHKGQVLTLVITLHREKASIQASQRRTERKLKELNATLDQERTQHVEQRDQVSNNNLQHFFQSYLVKC